MKSLNCPRCNAFISVPELSVYPYSDNFIVGAGDKHQILYKCNNPKCWTYIIEEWVYVPIDRIWTSEFTPYSYFPKRPLDFNFSQYPQISTISPLFINYYNQARHCDQLWYKDVAWPWYRKALEFLIKDFAISIVPNDTEKIKNMNLQLCIKTYLDNKILNSVSEKAYWVANDQTHYYTKWEDKDIETLKELIKLTIHHIESDIQSREILSSFEKPKDE